MPAAARAGRGDHVGLLCREPRERRAGRGEHDAGRDELRVGHGPMRDAREAQSK
jgi:hypothetical protein